MNYDTYKYECVTDYEIWSTFWTIILVVIVIAIVALFIWYIIHNQKKKQTQTQP